VQTGVKNFRSLVVICLEFQKKFEKIDRAGQGKLKLSHRNANEFLPKQSHEVYFFKKLVFSYLLAITLVIASTGFVNPPAAGQSNSTVSDQIIANSSTQLIRDNQNNTDNPITQETSSLDLGPELSRSSSDIKAQTASVKPIIKEVNPKPTLQAGSVRMAAPITLNSRDLLLLQQVVQAEFTTSTYRTKMMGLTVILNRTIVDHQTVRQVLLARGQFSTVSNGAIYRYKIVSTTKQAVADSLAGQRVFSLKAYYFWDQSVPRSNGLWRNEIIARSQGTIFANE
jgi:spore germination cell wall hydrolase CwlJ-like protein